MRVAKAYLAGTGATTALFAAGLVSFLSLAALLSFNGLPDGLESSSGDDSVFVGPASSAPETAAAAAAGTATAVAAAPVGAAAGGGAAGGGPGGGAPGGGVPGGGVPGGDGGVVPPGAALGVTPPGTAPPAGSPGAPSTTSGPLSNTVQGVEDTTESATGLDVPLTETTGPLTDKLDQTVNDTVGGV